MKPQKFVLWLGLLLFIAIVSGCAEPVHSTPTLSLEIPTVTVTIAKTAKPTLTPSATSTPIPATPTDILALPVDDARQRLLNLLGNNGNCQLPCLWGITPGTSTSLDARSILLPLRGIAAKAYFDPNSPDSISPFYLENSQRLYTEIAYLYNADGVINRIGFEVLEQQLSKDEYGEQLTTPIYGSSEFMQRVKYYSLSHLMNEQGIPTSVMISRELTYENNNGMRSSLVNIVVLYPNRGIWAKYTTSANEDELGNSLRSCPVNARIEMSLYPPENPDSFYALLEKTDWGITKEWYKPLEEATSMSVEEFYEIFQNSTDHCIQTPVNIWPTPER